jgi:hypothetical protein
MGTNKYLCLNNFKVRVISKKILREFFEKHVDCKQQLK